MSIILTKGPESNRGAVSLRPGEVIFATDTRRLYIGSSSVANGTELSFNQLSASFISSSGVNTTTLSVSEIIHGTSSWAETSSYLIGSIESASYAKTASYLLGSISSASYSTYSETSSYLSSSGQNIAVGDILSTDSSVGDWVGNQNLTGSGIFVQRSGNSARSTIFSAGTTITGNGAYTIAVSSGSLSNILPSVNGHFGSWQLQTFGGISWATSARMLIQTSGDHNEQSRPTDILFQSIPSGSTTLQTRLKVNGTGIQVTGSLSVTGSIGINSGIIFSKKAISLNTSSYITGLTINMSDDTSTYVKVSLHGQWQGSGSAAYVGEFFLQKDNSNFYRQPGAIISQINNNSCGEILANLNTQTPGSGAQNLQLQFWASSSAIPAGDFLMLYEVRGQYNSII